MRKVFSGLITRIEKVSKRDLDMVRLVHDENIMLMPNLSQIIL